MVCCYGDPCILISVAIYWVKPTASFWVSFWFPQFSSTPPTQIMGRTRVAVVQPPCLQKKSIHAYGCLFKRRVTVSHHDSFPSRQTPHQKITLAPDPSKLQPLVDIKSPLVSDRMSSCGISPEERIGRWREPSSHGDLRVTFQCSVSSLPP